MWSLGYRTKMSSLNIVNMAIGVKSVMGIRELEIEVDQRRKMYLSLK